MTCCNSCKTGKKCSTKLPTSGSEPIFSMHPWDTAVNSDNCYDYAIGDFERRRKVKSTPGDRAHMSANTLNLNSCKGLAKRILADNPKTVYKCKNPNIVCRRGYYKIMNFIAPGEDFHFYKQIQGVKYKVKAKDTIAGLAKFFKVTPLVIKTACKGAPIPGRIITFPVNLWTHKAGWGGPPLLTDSKGKTIRDPRRAGRNYENGALNYTKFCSAYCVKKDQAGSGSLSHVGLRLMRPARGRQLQPL